MKGNIYLVEAVNQNAVPLPIKSFTYSEPLEAGKTTRQLHEAITIPAHPNALYHVMVTINTNERIYEAGRLANNLGNDVTDVTPQSANLAVSQEGWSVVDADDPNDPIHSGDTVIISYTIENDSDVDVWKGTDYWQDFFWISADDQWIRGRATYLGTNVVPHNLKIPAHGTTEVQFTATLPEGTSGDYNIWVHMDAHNDLGPTFFPKLCWEWFGNTFYQAGSYPPHTGSNERWKSYFSHWAYEDPSDNLTKRRSMWSIARRSGSSDGFRHRHSRYDSGRSTDRGFLYRRQ